MNDSNPPPIPTPARFNWLLLLAMLSAPAVLTVLTVLLGAKSGDPAPVAAFFGGSAAGIVCGIMLGLRLGKTTPAKIALSLLFALVMSVVCIGMSCGGCLVSGYQLDLR